MECELFGFFRIPWLRIRLMYIDPKYECDPVFNERVNGVNSLNVVTSAT